MRSTHPNPGPFRPLLAIAAFYALSHFGAVREGHAGGRWESCGAAIRKAWGALTQAESRAYHGLPIWRRLRELEADAPFKPGSEAKDLNVRSIGNYQGIRGFDARVWSRFDDAYEETGVTAPNSIFRRKYEIAGKPLELRVAALMKDSSYHEPVSQYYTAPPRRVERVVQENAFKIWFETNHLDPDPAFVEELNARWALAWDIGVEHGWLSPGKGELGGPWKLEIESADVLWSSKWNSRRIENPTAQWTGGGPRRGDRFLLILQEVLALSPKDFALVRSRVASHHGEQFPLAGTSTVNPAARVERLRREVSTLVQEVSSSAAERRRLEASTGKLKETLQRLGYLYDWTFPDDVLAFSDRDGRQLLIQSKLDPVIGTMPRIDWDSSGDILLGDRASSNRLKLLAELGRMFPDFRPRPRVNPRANGNWGKTTRHWDANLWDGLYSRMTENREATQRTTRFLVPLRAEAATLRDSGLQVGDLEITFEDRIADYSRAVGVHWQTEPEHVRAMGPADSFAIQSAGGGPEAERNTTELMEFAWDIVGARFRNGERITDLVSRRHYATDGGAVFRIRNDTHSEYLGDKLLAAFLSLAKMPAAERAALRERVPRRFSLRNS